MTEREQIEDSMAALESQRAVLGDAVVDTALAALRAWRKAGAGEVAAFAYAADAALHYLGRALDLTPIGEPGLRYDLIRKRVHMLSLTGRQREEESQIIEMEGLAEALDDDARRAGAASLRARFAVFTGDYRAAAAAAARAVALADRSGHTGIALHARSVWASAARSAGDDARARVLADELLRMAGEAGDQPRLIDALHLHGSLAAHDGRYGVAREYYQRALELARAIQDKVFESVQLANLGEVERSLGNYAVAMDSFQTGLALCRDTGATMFHAHFLGEIAELANARGDSTAALAFVAEALPIARELSHGDMEAWLLTVQGDVRSALDQPSEAADAYRHALRLGQEQGRTKVPLDALAGLARAAAALGNFEEALTHVARIEEAVGAGDEPNGAPGLLCACHTVLIAAKSPRANDVLRRAHSLLMERAALLDEADRATFLGHVPSHRAIMRAWAASA